MPPRAKPPRSDGLPPGEARLGDVVVNLAGSYGYMEDGYYRSQALELQGRAVFPSTQDILDALVVPIALVRARQAGIAVPGHYISNGYFDPPVLLDPINPFMSGHAVVLRPGRRDQVARSMTRNFTYAMCCQELPAGARVGWFRMVLGWTRDPVYRPMAAALWELFRLPMARVRVIRPPEAPPLFSAMETLLPGALTAAERNRLVEGLEWHA